MMNQNIDGHNIAADFRMLFNVYVIMLLLLHLYVSVYIYIYTHAGRISSS